MIRYIVQAWTSTRITNYTRLCHLLSENQFIRSSMHKRNSRKVVEKSLLQVTCRIKVLILEEAKFYTFVWFVIRKQIHRIFYEQKEIAETSLEKSLLQVTDWPRILKILNQVISILSKEIVKNILRNVKFSHQVHCVKNILKNVKFNL